jgi:multidrug resistance efflux pump
MGEKKPRRAPRAVRLLLLLLVGLLAGYLWRSRPPSDRITVSGVVDATEVNVSSKVAGKLAAVLVGEGDSVRAGQVLARLDDAQLRDQVAAARATLAMMRTRAPQAQVSLALQRAETQSQPACRRAPGMRRWSLPRPRSHSPKPPSASRRASSPTPSSAPPCRAS